VPLVLAAAWLPQRLRRSGQGHGQGQGLKTTGDGRQPRVARPPRHAAQDPVRIDQRAFRFVPHVTAVVTGTTVRFLNNDPEQHNVYSPEGRYNLGTWRPGRLATTRSPSRESTPALQRAPGHARLHRRPRYPYFAVTDASGAFSISGVPPGSYKLVVWSEKLDGLERPVTVEAGKTLTLDLEVLR